jgi:lysozyme family protein
MTYPAEFNYAVNEVLRSEGGYSNDANDPGGETNFGISKRAYPGVDIANLTKEEAIAIYYRDYWLASKCDRLPPALASVVFDAAVNQGVERASRMLQAALGVTVDGIIGPQTIQRANMIPKTAVVDFTTQRILHYAGLPTFGRYGKGWVSRAVRTAMGAA